MTSGGSGFLRDILRQDWSLQLRPISDLAKGGDGSAMWCATGSRPRFALELPDARWTSCWVLLQSRLTSHSADHTARLYFDTGAGFGEEGALDMPVTHKGTIIELVYLPQGLVGVQWAPMHSAGTFMQSPFTMRRVGFTERLYRMLRRIVPVLWRQPRMKLDMLGLGFMRMLFDLRGAYAAAGKLRAYTAAPSYAQWIARADTLSGQDRRLIERHIARLAVLPRFVLLVAVPEHDTGEVARTRESIGRQLYRNVEVRVVGRAQFDSYAPEQAGDAYIAIVRAGDILPEHALYWVAAAIGRSPDAGLIYPDEDRLDESGVRCEPRFKPDWSPELLRSTNYIGQFVVFRSDELARAGGLKPEDVFGDNHDLLLRVCEGLTAERIVHVPAILIHRGAEEGAPGRADVVAAHLARKGIDATVSTSFPGGYRVRYALPHDMPMVSILVPTRDGLHLLKRCIDSIVQKTSYPDYEIIVIDNQSAKPDTLAYLAALASDDRARVLRHDEPFNYSAINNLAARQARGSVLCLLNNDTEVISPDWLEEMVGHLLQNKVGIVGAKLYYPDGRVQHGGDLVGVGGVANHAHAFLLRTDSGYCNRAMLAQELSAVTAACLLTWRSLYLELGGLDEENLTVAFNDVDYCLRVRDAGYRVVWTPHAELYHHESVSRGKDSTPEKKRRAKREAAYMRKRWKHVLQNDPYYNPNLTHERADFSLSHAPMVNKPWED